MRQLIVLGGGGFSQEKNRALDRHFLAQTGKKRPRVLFVGTASGDAEPYRERFYKAMAELPCRPTHLSLFAPPVADFESFVAGHDAIFVGGGNTRSLLALWREWKLDAVLHRAWRRGVVIGGVSAGMIAWFDWGVTDSVPGALTPLRCLRWLPGSACPHYDSEPERRPTYRRRRRAAFRRWRPARRRQCPPEGPRVPRRAHRRTRARDSDRAAAGRLNAPLPQPVAPRV